MSIEQKIEELLAEAEMAGQDPNNAKNNVNTQEIGGAADKVPNVVNQNATEPEEEEGIETDGVLNVAGDEPNNARAFQTEAVNVRRKTEYYTPDDDLDEVVSRRESIEKHAKKMGYNIEYRGLSTSDPRSQNKGLKGKPGDIILHHVHGDDEPGSIEIPKDSPAYKDQTAHLIASGRSRGQSFETNSINVDVSADVAALTEGEELTEQFKEKAAVIFEAAVVTRVKDEVSRIQEQLTEQYETRLNEEVEQIKEGLVEQIDGYLDYVVEQWIEQNEIALDQGLKSEILEGFIGGLKNLFEDHYIEMPEEKYDVLAGLEEEIQQLHSRLDEQVETNIGLKQKITGLQTQAVANQLAEGMVETDKAKFYSLLEDLEVESVESFEKKAQVIKESYFNKKPAAPQTGTFVSDNPVTLTEEKAQSSIPPQIKSYVSILDNLKK